MVTVSSTAPSPPAPYSNLYSGPLPRLNFQTHHISGTIHKRDALLSQCLDLRIEAQFEDRLTATGAQFVRYFSGPRLAAWQSRRLDALTEELRRVDQRRPAKEFGVQAQRTPRDCSWRPKEATSGRSSPSMLLVWYGANSWVSTHVTLLRAALNTFVLSNFLVRRRTWEDHVTDCF
jgi:hypothetical protein